MSVLREGGCACETVRYRLTSDPLFTHCCHCLNCQRQTGSAFVINLLIEADRVELLADAPQPVGVPRDDGEQRIFRCPTCQVAVFSEYTRPEVRFVRGGTQAPVTACLGRIVPVPRLDRDLGGLGFGHDEAGRPQEGSQVGNQPGIEDSDSHSRSLAYLVTATRVNRPVTPRKAIARPS